MNAIEFVKKYGIDSTREKIDFLENRSRNKSEAKVRLLIDLKQIVEAFDNVNKHGGVLRAKSHCEKFKDMGGESTLILMRHINLVEQCKND